MKLINLIKITLPAIALAIATAESASASDGEMVYNKTCKMCHGQGMMNAPKVGDKTNWQARLVKGMDTLYDHALNGFKDVGNMPARGGNKKLTDDEVKAAVDYMIEHSK